LRTKKCFAGILTTDISDHLTYFIFINQQNKLNKGPMEMTYCPINYVTLHNFKEKFSNLNWNNVLNIENPEEADNTFQRTTS
jgi:hypothetical protein